MGTVVAWLVIQVANVVFPRQARLVESADDADGAGDTRDTIRSAPDSAAAAAQTPADVARSFWNAWARIDSVIIEETESARVGQDRAVVPTRLGMSAGSSSFVISFQTTLVAGEDRWRVEQLGTTRALALTYIEVMAEQLRRAGDALEEVREDTTKRRS